MKPRESIYQYTHTETGTTFFATEENAELIIIRFYETKPADWKKEYISEVWQITGEKTEEILVDPITDTQRVNCLNLVPATVDIRRPYCDMGDGRIGDCRIYLKTAECCRRHDPKIH